MKIKFMIGNNEDDRLYFDKECLEYAKKLIRDDSDFLKIIEYFQSEKTIENLSWSEVLNFYHIGENLTKTNALYYASNSEPKILMVPNDEEGSFNCVLHLEYHPDDWYFS